MACTDNFVIVMINSVIKIHVTSYMQSNPVNTDTEGALESVHWCIKGVSY